MFPTAKKPRKRVECPVCGYSTAVRDDGRLYSHDRHTSLGRRNCLGGDSQAGDEALKARAPLYLAADVAANRLARTETAVRRAHEVIASEEPKLPALREATEATGAALAAHDAAALARKGTET